MLVATLDAMARGGLMDQLAGGFHRYSTDEAWLVPHFEKMLYDNAALARLYAEAAPFAEGAGFERVARQTLDFVLRELTGDEGGFLSAIDAETDGHEGAYYTWTAAELDAVLRGEDGRLFRVVHGLEGEPTFEADRYVVYVPAPYAEQARTGGLAEAELLRRLEPGRRALARGARRARAAARRRQGARRLERAHDRGARARLGACSREPRYLAAAERAASFVLTQLRDPGTRDAAPHLARGPRAASPPTSTTTRSWSRACSSCTRPRASRAGSAEAVRLSEEQERRLADAGGRRLLLGRRRRAPAASRQDGLRRRGRLGQRHRRAECGRAGAAHGRRVPPPARGGDARRVRGRDGGGAARARDARPGARAAAGPSRGRDDHARGHAAGTPAPRRRRRPPPRARPKRSRRRPTPPSRSTAGSARARTTSGSRSGSSST